MNSWMNTHQVVQGITIAVAGHTFAAAARIDADVRGAPVLINCWWTVRDATWLLFRNDRVFALSEHVVLREPLTRPVLAALFL